MHTNARSGPAMIRRDSQERRTYLTIVEFALYLRQSRWTVARRIAAGEFDEVIGEGAPWTRIPVPAIHRYLAAHVVPRETDMTMSLTAETELADPPLVVGALPKLFTFAEIAGVFELTERQFTDLVKRAKYRHYQFGAARRMDQQQIEELLATSEQADISPAQINQARAEKLLARSRKAA